MTPPFTGHTKRLRRHDILFEPVTIGPKVLKNRFYAVPHCTGFGTEKPFSQAAFRGMKAEGGWAAVCTEYAPVSEDSDSSPWVSARIWDDDDGRNLALMTEEVHRHGALAGLELHHAGAMAHPRESRWPAVGPSAIANDVYPTSTTPREMDEDDIARVERDFVTAAARGRDVGFDIVYVYGAHSFLFSQFLSPVLNQRSDRYGGKLENRARLWRETLELVREAVGADCAVAVRMAVDALGPWGVHREEALEFVASVDHLVDLWDLSIGAVAGSNRVDSGASRFFKEGYQLEWTHGVSKVTRKPVVGVGRFTNPDTMADLVRSRELDLIGAARPSIADPFLPRKIEEGRYEDIRECIGCNFCYSRAEYGGHLNCTQNATAGEEHRRGWHPERFARSLRAEKDVLVVGAGPAGLECAIVLAERGFSRIHLVDESDGIGGHLQWMTRLPGLGEWGRLAGWRKARLDSLRKQIELIQGTRLTRDDLGYGAEIVICATGSYWSRDGLFGATGHPIPGAAESALVLTPEQVMIEGKRPRGGRVVVYDCDGYVVGAAIAELLAAEGSTVTLVTPHSQVAPVCHETLEGYFVRRRLHEEGVRMVTATVITAVDDGSVTGTDEFGQVTHIEVDGVVLVTQRLPRDGLYRDLTRLPVDERRSGGVESVYRAGDCAAPRMLGDAVFDGHRLAREIDADDPLRPAPYKRERPVVAVAAEAGDLR